MNNQKITSDVLDKHNTLVEEIIGKLLNTLIKEVGVLSLKQSSLLKKDICNRIIDEAVTYSLAINYDEFTVSNYDECLLSLEVNNQESYLIPDKNRTLYKKCFNEHINKYIEENKHLFLINISKEFERWRMIKSSVIIQIKLQYNQFIEECIEREQPIELGQLLFREDLNASLIGMINNSIVDMLNYESGKRDKEEYKRRMSRSSSENYNYELEEYSKNLINKRAHEFLRNYANKRKLLKEDSEEIMLETIALAKKDINDLFNYYSNRSTKDEYKKIFNDYNIFLNYSKERIVNSSKFSKFLVYLEKAKMNYVIEYKEKKINPFIYDLLVMSFSLNSKMIAYREEASSVQAALRMAYRSKYEDVSKDSSINYLDLDFVELINIIPDGFTDMTKIILKHYSEVLNTSYQSVAIVFKQLTSDKTRNTTRRKYVLEEKDAVIENLSINPDYFRSLSLDII